MADATSYGSSKLFGKGDNNGGFVPLPKPIDYTKPIDCKSVLTDDAVPPTETYITFTLGVRYSDKITGFTGTATALAMELHATDTVRLECGGDDGEPKREWFEVSRLEEVAEDEAEIDPVDLEPDDVAVTYAKGYRDGHQDGAAVAYRTDSVGVFWPQVILDETVPEEQQTPLERLHEDVTEALRDYGYGLVDDHLDASPWWLTSKPVLSAHPVFGLGVGGFALARLGF